MTGLLKNVFRTFLLVIILTLLNCCCLVLSFCLPTAPMRSHVAESYPLIEQEHQYLQWDQGYTSSKLDFWSEYTLYGVAINEDAQGSAFEKAMRNWYIDPPGVDRDKAVGQYAKDKDEIVDITSYSRYWLGIVMFMKLLLLKFTIHDIRMINMFLHITLLVIIIILMVKKDMIVEIIPFLTAILFINPVTMLYSVKFSAEYIPMLLGIIIILVFGEYIDNKNGWGMFFAILGSVVSFLCMLSSPGIALGIPLVVMIWCTKEKNVVKKVVSACCYWGGAYAITWAMKWIICTLFTSYNLLEDAIQRMDLYENVDHASNSGTTIMERLVCNIEVYNTPAFAFLFVVSVIAIVLAVCIASRKAGRKESTGNITDVVLGYVFIALIPVAIIVGLGNGYAYWHFYMAHRHFSITVLAGLCIVQRLLGHLLQKRGE